MASRFRSDALNEAPFADHSFRFAAYSFKVAVISFFDTGGITGHVTELLSRAAEAAIRSKKECITPELLQSVIGARTFA